MSVDAAHDPNSAASRPLPVAVVRPARRVSAAWLVPLGAVIFVLWLGWRAWEARGLSVVVHLPEGHGLKAGDDVRYRGIAVGVVDSVQLSSDLNGVDVVARLTSQADRIARSGARFWVVRPELGLTRIEGIDTIIGPRFLAVLPSDDFNTATQPQRTFVGLIAPPLVSERLPGDLEIIFEASERGSMVAGAPVFYRQTRIGTVLSVGLAADGGSVEARAHIQQPFVPLIRERTRFWDAGGLKAKVGLTGFSLNIESAEALLAGGVALATPPHSVAGDIVRTGHRFRLEIEVKDEWQLWRPQVAIGNSMLPPGKSPPSPLRASLAWEQGRIISRERRVQGWLLQTDQGLLGPADLLVPGDRAQEGTVSLEVAGEVAQLTAAPAWNRHGLALLKHTVSNTVAWPMAMVRNATDAEDCVVISDATADPLPIAAARLRVIPSEAGSVAGWNIDRAITIDPSWHGACVVSRRDGMLIGMIVLDESGSPRIAALQVK